MSIEGAEGSGGRGRRGWGQVGMWRKREGQRGTSGNMEGKGERGVEGNKWVCGGKGGCGYTVEVVYIGGQTYPPPPTPKLPGQPLAGSATGWVSHCSWAKQQILVVLWGWREPGVEWVLGVEGWRRTWLVQ